MKNSRTSSYQQHFMQGVNHTTLNPYGPGVVRIHLVPPREDAVRISGNKHIPSIVILNGKDIIPINISWAILLNEFINHLNNSAGYGTELTATEMKKIVNEAILDVKKVFPHTSKIRLKRDLLRIVNTLCDIAYGKKPTEKIGFMSIGEYAPFMKAPHRMDLMVSSMMKDGKWHCNQKCLHCYAAGQNLAETEEISTEQWKEIIDRIREIGIPQITFTGGEPTMRDDLVELIDYGKWFVTRLNTNGIRLTPTLCQKLYDASLDSVQITLYSNDSNIHNELVGSNTYTQTVAGIKNALEAKLNVSINTPLCSINQNYLSTLQFAFDMGVTYVTCSGLIVTGNACSDKSRETQLSNEKLYEILKEAKAFCDEHHMQISFTSPGWIDGSLIAELGMEVPTCGACLSNMAVAPNGDIIPCQSWLSDIPLGNMLDKSWGYLPTKDFWEIIWDSTPCKTIREVSARMIQRCPLRTFR